MKPHSWWVVRVSFRKGNRAHTAIGEFLGYAGGWDLHGRYEGIEKVFVPDVLANGGEFSVLREIEEMR